MDTSKEYIRMCEKAEEIQREYKPKTGDFQANKILFIVTVYSGKYPFNKKKIWLPRQDQLQEMLPYTFLGLLDTFRRFCFLPHEGNKKYKPIELFTSMEQLWLAFVMTEKYQKQWDGEKWIK